MRGAFFDDLLLYCVLMALFGAGAALGYLAGGWLNDGFADLLRAIAEAAA